MNDNDAEDPLRGLRLLLVVNVSWFFISHRLALAIAAKSAGMDVHVATHVDNSDDAATIERFGIRVHDIPMGRGTAGIWSDLRCLAALMRLLRRLRPDITHNVTMKPVVLCGSVARLLGSRATVQAMPGLGYALTSLGLLGRARAAILKFVLGFTCNRPRLSVILQNAEDAKTLVAEGIVRPADVRLIRGSGVDVSAVTKTREPTTRPVRVVLASRLLKEKGVAEFVAAATLLKSRGVEAAFEIWGKPDPGNPSSICQETLRKWHDSGFVAYRGYSSNMLEVFSDSHVVCLPTYYGEGVPKVLIEAAACGRPIVTTDIAGCRDIVRHELNGLLVPPRDVESLAQSLERLIEDAGLRVSFGNAGRRLAAEEFDLSIVLSETLAVYRDLATR